jgi:hypothetical protein
MTTPTGPKAQEAGWYCPHCHRGVDGREVTFHEQHETCGTYIGDAQPPARVVSDESIRKAARALCKRSSDACGVDFEDNWKLYYADFEADARAALSTLQSGAEGKDGLPELPELPKGVRFGNSAIDINYRSVEHFTADQMRAYANGHATYWYEMHRAANKRAEGLQACIDRVKRWCDGVQSHPNIAYNPELYETAGKVRTIIDAALQPGQGAGS